MVPLMKSRGGGSIINISSLAATYGMPNGLHYNRVESRCNWRITRGLARELGQAFNIRVNSVAPNVVDTDATGEVFGDKRDKIVEVTTVPAGHCASRWNPTISSARFCTSRAKHSRLTTGQTIMVDGGTVSTLNTSAVLNQDEWTRYEVGYGDR